MPKKKEIAAYEQGYRHGKQAANADYYALGYQDAFCLLRKQIEDFLETESNMPIPAGKHWEDVDEIKNL